MTQRHSGPDPSGKPLENEPPEEEERVGKGEIGLRDRGGGMGELQGRTQARPGPRGHRVCHTNEMSLRGGITTTYDLIICLYRP